MDEDHGSPPISPTPRRSTAPSTGLWTKRWRVKAYQRAFLIEPNIIVFDDPVSLRGSPQPHKTTSCSVEEALTLGPPQLTIFRNKPDMVESPHSSRTDRAAQNYGPFECSIQVDAILGILNIKAYRFLVLAVECDTVASLPPDCSPLGVKLPNESVADCLSRCGDIYPIHRDIYAISKALLLPFHIPSNIYLAVKLKIDSIVSPSNMRSARHRALSGEGDRQRPRRVSAAETLDTHQAGRHRRSVTPGPEVESSSWKEGTLESVLFDMTAPVLEVEKTLGKKTFFFSYGHDLARSLQRQYKVYKETGIFSGAQPVPLWYRLYGNRRTESNLCFFDLGPSKFVWNASMCQSFWEHGIDPAWLVPVIQGAISSTIINLGNVLLRMVLIGRRSSARGGTRYFSRGVNSTGEVANFCELEFLSCSYSATTTSHFPATSLHQPGGGWFAFTQVRGSLPVFWEQSSYGINPVPKVTGSPEANVRAFVSHQRKLENRYGPVIYLDLLSQSKQGESKLSESFQECLLHQRTSQGLDLLGVTEVSSFNYSAWDFHAQTQAMGFEDALRAFNQKVDIQQALQEMGYFHVIGPKVQKGVFRVNCLDCLDRTNVMQWFLAQRQHLDFLRRSPKGETIMSAKGVKYSQDVYAWLIRQTDEADAIHSFTKDNKPTRVLLPLRPRAKPVTWAWDFDSAKIKIPAPFPQSAGATTLTYLKLPGTSNEEYRVYFMGGWTDHVLTTTFYRPYGVYSAVNPIQAFQPSGPTSAANELSSGCEDVYRSEETAGVGVPIASPYEEGDINVPATYVYKDAFSSLWADSGDLISIAYTGTGSVMTPLIKSGKSTLLTNLTHLKRTMGRLYKQNFEDKAKQECIDLILGTHRWSAVNTMLSSKEDSGPESNVAREPSQALSERYQVYPKPVAFALTLWAGTWNVAGGSQLATEDLSFWLNPTHTKADVYAISMQEIVELTSSWTLLNQTNRSRESEALRVVKKILGPEYLMIGMKTMIGVHLSVFARLEYYGHTSEVEVLDAKMGFMGGQLGNKGAVVVRFRLFERTWCFVTAHLVPDKGGDKSVERLVQIEKILSLKFPTCGMMVEEHDYLIMGGDLNFPAMAQVGEIQKWLESRNFEEFFRRDQLTWLKSKESTLFRHLTEAPILFWPSYKYRKGTSQYDRRRPPSWCDRVLYGGLALSRDTSKFIVHKYDRIRAYHSSDHKPVYLVLTITEGEDTEDDYSEKNLPQTAETDPIHPPSIENVREGKEGESSKDWLESESLIDL